MYKICVVNTYNMKMQENSCIFILFKSTGRKRFCHNLYFRKDFGRILFIGKWENLDEKTDRNQSNKRGW